MRLAPKTWLLGFVAAVLAVLNLFGPRAAEVESLPSLPPVRPAEVVKVTISNPIDRVVLERVEHVEGKDEADRWRVTDPLDVPADAAQIRAFLRIFGPGVPMQVLVDRGHLEDYGVDDQHGKLVELWTGSSEPAVAVWVGRQAAGGATFVRIPGDDAVYRADVGGQARVMRAGAEWRDRTALELDPDTLVELRVERAVEPFTLVREPGPDGKPGPWRLVGLDVEVDTAAADTFVRTLAKLRAGEILSPDYDAGFAAPAAVLTLTDGAGVATRVVLGAKEVEGAAFVRVSDRDEVFRVSAVVRRALTQPVAALRSRRLLSFERAAVEAVAYVEGGLTIVLGAQDAEGAQWKITQPPNMDVDQRQALFTVSTLAALRASGAPADAAFNPSGARFEIRYRDGRVERLELGQVERDGDDQPMVRVRSSAVPGVFWLKQVHLAELKKAFGRG